MSNRYSVIDVTRLGVMNVIVPSDAEEILARRMGSFKANWLQRDPPMGAAYDVEGLEFDPAKITMEVGTSYQVNIEARINAAARGTSLAFATGADLDGIATRYPGGVPRLNKGLPNEETDDRYRWRIWLAANAFSTAGAEEAYVFHAMTAVAELKHVTATVQRTIEGPTVIVTCLLEGSNPIPSTEQLLTVRKALHQPGVKPLTDIISVMEPIVVDTAYDADVWLRPGPDASLVLDALHASLDEHLAASNWLGGDHTLLGFNGVLARPEVHSALIRAPLTDLHMSPRQVVRVKGSPVINVKGRRS